jgi:hypothetical protein
MGGWWSNLWSCAVGKDALPFFYKWFIERHQNKPIYIYISGKLT